MKGLHIVLVLLVVAAFLVASKYPQVGQSALSKVGL